MIKYSITSKKYKVISKLLPALLILLQHFFHEIVSDMISYFLTIVLKRTIYDNDNDNDEMKLISNKCLSYYVFLS